MKVIELNEVFKIYNESGIEVRAVDDVTFEVDEGEFTVIVGPSGSGKTTLLNLIGGLDKPTSGDVMINGSVTNVLTDRELINFRLFNIGFVFQSYNLIPVLTARENIEFVMRLQGKSDKECRQRSDELLEAIGLADRHKARPSKLSGGQQQRVAVARALAPKPHFILADEPTANLDSVATETLIEIMQKLNTDENITFLFSTHDQRVVKKARRIINLQDGKVVSDLKVNQLVS
jgi:putative ABC transport system ATP-binding protein